MQLNLYGRKKATRTPPKKPQQHPDVCKPKHPRWGKICLKYPSHTPQPFRPVWLLRDIHTPSACDSSGAGGGSESSQSSFFDRLSFQLDSPNLCPWQISHHRQHHCQCSCHFLRKILELAFPCHPNYATGSSSSGELSAPSPPSRKFLST